MAPKIPADTTASLVRAKIWSPGDGVEPQVPAQATEIRISDNSNSHSGENRTEAVFKTNEAIFKIAADFKATGEGLRPIKAGSRVKEAGSRAIRVALAVIAEVFEVEEETCVEVEVEGDLIKRKNDVMKTGI